MSTIDLAHRLPLSERRRRGFRKALKAGVDVREGRQFLPEVWNVLAENLARKHGAAPVHSVDELSELHAQFPNKVRIVAALLDGRVHAGVVLFVTPRVVHAQYIASSSTGYDVAALDAVFDHCIAEAAASGARYFDFGSSTEQDGRHLNAGLFQFKSEFGAGSVAHDFYELELGTAR